MNGARRLGGIANGQLAIARLTSDGLLDARFFDVGANLVSLGTFQPNGYEQGQRFVSFIVGRSEVLPTPLRVYRNYIVADVPAEIDGAALLRTANKDKKFGDECALTFALGAAGTVRVAYDSRARSLPRWLRPERGWRVTAQDGRLTVFADRDARNANLRRIEVRSVV